MAGFYGLCLFSFNVSEFDGARLEGQGTREENWVGFHGEQGDRKLVVVLSRGDERYFKEEGEIWRADIFGVICFLQWRRESKIKVIKAIAIYVSNGEIIVAEKVH